MAKLRRTLIIGLGGTGFKAILNAKKMLYENYGEIPPMIGFLGIDTDKPGLEIASVTAKDGTKISLNKNEQLSICVEEPMNIYERNSTTDLFDWMPQCNASGLTTLTIGAGQMRSNGRFAVTVNEHNIEQSLTRKLADVNDARVIDNEKYGLLGADTEVHLVFSLGGGTGSGTFLNIAYLIQRLMPKVKISGYAVLSDVFRTMVSGAMSSRVRPNAKGAIIDLDYLAHLEPNSEPVEIKWFQKTDSVKTRPFTALYFIDNRNDHNDMFSDVAPICEMISLAIVTSVGELGVTLDSIADNVNKLISDGTMDIKNKKAWVASMGCAEIVFDSHRLAEIYARKACIQIVNSMLNGGCDDPVNIANAWFDTSHIRENLGKDDVIDYFMAPNPPYTFSDIDTPENPEPECRDFINNRAMERPENLTQKLNDLEARIDLSLGDLLTREINRECGVFLCDQILHSILNTIELCDSEMKSEIERLEDALPGFESALTTSCKELADCMDSFFKKGRKGFEEEVAERTMALAVQKREIERRKYARLFYDWLRVRVRHSLQRADIIMENLQAVRNECNNQVQHLIREGGATSFFQFDLSATEAEKVTCPISDVVFNNFVRAMVPEGGIQSMATMTSMQTEEVILRFARTMPKVKEYEAMTVDTALDTLSQEELESLVRRAINKSLPLISYTYRGFDADLKERPVESYYIGVANKANSRLYKENLLQNLVAGAKDVQFSETGLNNRIIIYRQLGVIPAFTVKPLDNYTTEYDKWENDKPHGSHWDKKLHEKMINERFSLMPRDVVSESRILDIWVQAIIYDLISYNAETGQYQIKSKGMGGRPLKGWLVDMGDSRDKAYRYLEDNLDILEPEIKQALADMDKPGPDNAIRKKAKEAVDAAKDGTYLTAISKCPISAENIEHYPKEVEIIEKEITHILDHA